jgi:DNA-binding transcriptional regulator YbjK
LTPPGDRPRGAARREAIVDAALTLLGRGGSGAVTHRAVASEAEVPLAATTYYFETKDELVLEAFALARSRDVAALEASGRPGASACPTVEELAAWLVAQFLPRGDDARCAQLVLYELELEAARRPELAELSRTWTDAYVAALAPVVAELGARDPERDAWIVVTALEGISLELLASGVHQPEVARPYVERLLAALTGAAAD